VHEFTVVGILNVDHSPAVLAPTDRLALNDHVVFRANNSERNDFLKVSGSISIIEKKSMASNTPG
jgi:hypothetical protein